MPPTRELNINAYHVECPACGRWVEYDGFIRHWAGARHYVSHGEADLDQLCPRKLNRLSPLPTVPRPSPAFATGELSPESPQPEGEQSEAIRGDEDYPGAGMHAVCLILMF